MRRRPPLRGVEMMAAARRVIRWLCVAIVSPACCILLHLQAAGSYVDVSLRDLRYQGVIPQTSDYSCGAAAVACLLQVYYGIPATERRILELAEQQMLARGEDPGLMRGLTAYDLKIASETLGLNMAGYELTHPQMEDYFERGGLPLIGHVTEPQSHYLVVVGMTTRHVLLLDPAWGRHIASIHELADVRCLSGVFLVPLPTMEEALHARKVQLSALEWMRTRVCELADLREAML
jgi:hypothetical protein